MGPRHACDALAARKGSYRTSPVARLDKLYREILKSLTRAHTELECEGCSIATVSPAKIVMVRRLVRRRIYFPSSVSAPSCPYGISSLRVRSCDLISCMCWNYVRPREIAHHASNPRAFQLFSSLLVSSYHLLGACSILYDHHAVLKSMKSQRLRRIRTQGDDAIPHSPHIVAFLPITVPLMMNDSPSVRLPVPGTGKAG